MRDDMFRKMNSSQINFKNEIERVNVLFSKRQLISYSGITQYGSIETAYVSIEQYIDANLFLQWKHRKRYLNINDMRSDLHISDNDLNNNDLDTMLTYFEFVLNMICLTSKKMPPKYSVIEHGMTYFEALIKNIKNVLEEINYEIKNIDDEKLIIVVKNQAANAVAEIHEDIRDKVFEYNKYNLKGNLERKRGILLALGDKFEPLQQKLKEHGFNNLENNAGFLLNHLHIRHNNVDGGTYKKDFVAKMKPAELEKWYDNTYDLLLLTILCSDYIEKKDDIKDLKSKING